MSLAAMIRRAVGGKGLEEQRPEDEPEKEGADEAPERDDDAPEDTAEDDDPERDAEDDEPEKDDAEEDKNMSAEQRTVFAKGRDAERKRIGAILGSKAAEANPGLAAHLAFATRDRASKAVATLKAAGPSNAGGLASRMSNRQPSRTGRGGENTSRAKDAGAAWDGAFAKAGVKTKGK